MRLKYITLNVWHGGKLWDQIVEFLQKENPDILAIQEAYQSSDNSLPKNFRTAKELQNILNFKQTYFELEFLNKTDYGDIETGNAILSKFPILEESVYFFNEKSKQSFDLGDLMSLPNLPRNLQYVVIDVKGVKLNVFNTHGIWGEHGEDTKERLDMSKKIVDQIKNKKKVILSGDFNVNQDTESINNIENEVRNVFKDELKTSFNMEQKPLNSGYSQAVVDNIFVSSDIEILDHYCPQVDISDHLPLVVILEV